MKTQMPSNQQNKARDYSVGIVGLGDVGQETCHLLPDIEQVNRIYLFTSDPGKGRKCELNYGGKKYVQFLTRGYTDISDELNNIDIMIITSDNTNYKQRIMSGEKLVRKDLLYPNIEIMKMLGPQMRDFSNPVIVDTNPVDHMAYLFAVYSGISPEYITGQSHIDLQRWQNLMRKLFTGHNLDLDLVNRIRILTIGTHSEEIVPIFRDFGGLSRADLTFLNDPAYSALRQQLREYPKEQFRLGGSTAKLTARSNKEVIEAQINEEDMVCQSAYLSPEMLGIKGTLEGSFFVHPIKFKEGKAVLLPQTIDDYQDKLKISKQHSELENDLIQLRSKGYFTDFLGRIHPFPSSGHKPKKEKPMLDLGARVIAANGDTLYEWEDPNIPNTSNKRKLDRSIFSLESLVENGNTHLLIGQEGGISMLSPDYKREEHFRCSPDSAIRKIATAEDKAGRIYLAAASDKELFLFDFANPRNPIFSAKYDKLINNLTLAPPFLLVASDKLYELPLDSPEESQPYEIKAKHEGISDANFINNNIILAYDSKLIRWDHTRPGTPFSIQTLPCTDISRFKLSPYLEGSIFVATTDPELYRLRLETGAIESRYDKHRCNSNGTGSLELVGDNGSQFLLAADKSRYVTTQNAGISIWDVVRPAEPIVFLPTNEDHSIRGLAVIKHD